MVVMGRIAGAFGIKGFIRVQTFSGTVDALLDYPVWWIGDGDRWEERKLVEGAVHGQALVAKLEGVEGREVAARMRGLHVGIPRQQLPPNAEGEYYWADLIGLEVANREGVALGRVAQLLETGANQVLVVKGTREYLIPFVEPVMVSVDLAGGRLIVDWGADF